jgi:hypothetical protein
MQQNDAVRLVEQELTNARVRFLAFQSPHEGAAVIREEFDEFWREVMANDRVRAREEAVQLAAMATRFLIDVPAHGASRPNEALRLINQWNAVLLGPEPPTAEEILFEVRAILKNEPQP